MRQMRFIFYTISGIVSALIGWSISQVFVIDLPQAVSIDSLPFHTELIVFPLVAASLAVAMVVTEIFLSNPTRWKANKRVLPRYFWPAVQIGLAAGLVAFMFFALLRYLSAPALIVRVVAWSLIGVFTGLGEGLSWRLRSIEGATRRANQRIQRSTLYGLGAGFVAAIVFEFLHKPLGGYAGPVGFLILGLFLGLSLSVASSPAYQTALRAGEGFESVYGGGNNGDRPRLSNSLRFVSRDDNPPIEEGLSIELPAANARLLIGSSADADIQIPNIYPETARLHISDRQVAIESLREGSVAIQAWRIPEGTRPQTLRHNQILTFYHAADDERYYRFVFYDRFLDPEA
jgi:hypothetical protein